MRILGFIFCMPSVVFLIVWSIPGLGFLNWFTTLPAAVLGAFFSIVKLQNSKSAMAVITLIISAIVFVLVLGRLMAGCGII